MTPPLPPASTTGTVAGVGGPAALKCPCGATARDTQKERGRFLARHMGNCKTAERKAFTKQLAAGVRSVMADENRDFKGGQL